ncbi:hypothetical protein [Streptomyces syringium]|uniref:hypothetical protein n=1 Tax=Streptomyces syringium TaxID=76729 RepID=UPI0034329A45
MISRARRMLLAGVIGGVSAVTAASAIAFAAPAPAADDATPPSAIEDYAYPGAAKILKETGITLHKGDGRILLGDCATDSDIIVMTRPTPQTKADKYCFRLTGDKKSGYLTLEIPRVFGLQTEDHPIRATVTAGGAKQVVDVPKNDLKGVGEGIPGGEPTALVELRVTG